MFRASASLPSICARAYMCASASVVWLTDCQKTVLAAPGSRDERSASEANQETRGVEKLVPVCLFLSFVNGGLGVETTHLGDRSPQYQTRGRRRWRFVFRTRAPIQLRYPLGHQDSGESDPYIGTVRR